MRLAFFVALLVGTFANVSFSLRTGEALSCYNLGIDTDKYQGAALRILQSGAVDVPPLQPPGFILFLAFVYKVLGPRVLIPKLLACSMILAMSLGVWWLGRRFAGELEGVIAGLLTVFSPMLRAYAATIQYEVLAAFLFLASVMLILWGAHESSRGWSLLLLSAGAIVGGIAALTRETFSVVFLVLLLYQWARTEGNLRRRLGALALTGALFSVTVGAWVGWQSWRNGRLIPISEKGPINFVFGNNPNANGTFNQTLKPVLEPSGWEFIRSRPRQAAWLAARKLGYFWGFLKDGWNVPRRSALVLSRLTLGTLPLSWSEALARGAVSVVAVVGMGVVLFTARLRRDLWVLPAAVVVMLAIHIATLSSHRFAVPVLPLVFLLAGTGVAAASRWLTRRVGWRVIGIAVALFAAWSAFALGSPRMSRLELEGEDLDGIQAADVLDSAARNGQARFADRAQGRREMAVLTDEFLPRGPFRLSLFVRGSGPGELVEVTMPLAEGGLACRKRLRMGSGRNYERVVLTGRLEHDAAAKIVVETEAVEDVWLDRLSIEAGLPLEEMKFERDLFADPRVEEEVLDLGSPGLARELEQDGWSGDERWGTDFTFQWAEGKRSTLALPLAEARNLTLEVRACPFSAEGLGTQKVHILVNGSEAGIIPLKDGWRSYALAIGKENLRVGVNSLVLLHDRATRPADVPGHGTDRRALAAAYDTIKLRKR